MWRTLPLGQFTVSRRHERDGILSGQCDSCGMRKRPFALQALPAAEFAAPLKIFGQSVLDPLKTSQPVRWIACLQGG